MCLYVVVFIGVGGLKSYLRSWKSANADFAMRAHMTCLFVSCYIIWSAPNDFKNYAVIIWENQLKIEGDNMEDVTFNKVNSFYEVTPKSWEDAKKIRQCLDGYVFRGHADKTWTLKTSLERAVEQHQQDSTNPLAFETTILGKFISRAHHYVQSPPGNNEIFEWLSLLQDFGGPTRLLDFTDSFYIAAFFATELAERDACIWAINEQDLSSAFFTDSQASAREAYDSTKYVEEVMARQFYNENDLVLAIRPSRLNERIAIQKGLFLFPRNLSNSFEKNLCSTFGFEFDALVSKNSRKTTTKEMLRNLDDSPSVLKINLSHKWNYDVVSDLYSMNIDSASLFPGLDGFARSLRFVVRGDKYKPLG